MGLLIGLMVLGIGVGYLLRGRAAIRWASQWVTVVVYVLLLVLGISLGASVEVRGALLQLGGQAGALAWGGVLGSVLLAFLFGLWVDRALRKR